MSRERYANLRCFEDFETEVRDYVTTDPTSTPLSSPSFLMRRFHVTGMVSIHNVLQKGWVAIAVSID